MSQCKSPRSLPILIAALAFAAGLAGCATHPAKLSRLRQPGDRHFPHYDAPGPPEDPWGPYIRAAAARFGVSEIWIRAIMQQESGGQQFQGDSPTTSPMGAMGLMQVMPDTYAEMRLKYGLGDDPYEPHDNIFAGTAYIREMYDEFGFPSFIAAYNAGPDQLEACLAMGVPLPQETVSYLSAVAPRLRPYAPLSGPLAAYAEIVPDAPADDLNRRILMGQALPTVVHRSAPALPCMPPASDRSADALNRTVLSGGLSASAPDPDTEALNRQSLARTAR
jgi:hypothetical protein